MIRTWMVLVLICCLPLTSLAVVGRNIYTHPANKGVVLYPNVDRILIIGDGLVSHHQVGRSRSLEETLARFLRMAGYVDTQVVSIAEPKLNSSAARLKMPSILEYYKPSIVIMALGYEDVIRQEKLKSSMQLMDEMLTQLKKAKIRILLVGVKPPEDAFPFYKEKLPQVYQYLASKHQIPLYPELRAGLSEENGMLMKDKIHPSPKGVRFIAQQLQPTIEAMLEKLYEDRRFSEQESFYSEEIELP